MKIITIALFLVWSVPVNLTLVRASSPPPQKTLAERVEMATNVIIGTVKKVTVLEFKDGKLQEIRPEPKNIAPSGQFAELEIEVNEVLYPLEWKPKQTVKFLFGGGWFEVASLRKDCVEKKLIYLMKTDFVEIKAKGEVFVPSYGWHLAESLDKKDNIQAILAEKTKPETAPKAPSPEGKQQTGNKR